MTIHATGALADNAAPAPLRHLVYNFTFGSQSDTEIHTSGFGAGGPGEGSDNMSGNATVDNTGSVQDHGTIVVDVLGERADGGLVINVSEDAIGERTSYTAGCIVYSDTKTLCDQTKRVNEEELAIVRLLGPHFVDMAQIDPKMQWKTSNVFPGFSQHSNFTIDKNDGGVMNISESGTTSQSTLPKLESTTTGTIGYNANLQVLMSLNSYTISHRQLTIDQLLTSKAQVTAKLVSDSMAKKP